MLLWAALQSRQMYFEPYGVAAKAADFLLNVGAILFATTIYSSAPLLLNILLLSPVALLHIIPKTAPRTKKAKPPPGAVEEVPANPTMALEPFPVHPFLTMYRSAMMIVTCVAILAVDFPIFPRRFGKVENWGTSLMDLGVGSFVFSAGVVSARAVLKTSTASKSSARGRPLVQRVLASLRHAVPLVVLGLIRLYSVKGLDYAEHVTEYGVHWNFFFTLALLPPVVETAHSIVTTIIPSYSVLSLLVAVAYQVVLESTDLKAYILVSPRGPDLLSKNREGIFSFIGYLAIFLAGRAAGLTVIPRSTDPTQTPAQARQKLLVRLLMTAGNYALLYYFTSTYGHGIGQLIPVSRRMANLPYVLWVSAFNMVQLFLFCAIETVYFPAIHTTSDPDVEKEKAQFATSRVMAAFNSNGLAVFLVANLLTGAVNLSVKTLDASNLQAMGILLGYMMIVSGVALGMNAYGLKVKL